MSSRSRGFLSPDNSSASRPTSPMQVWDNGELILDGPIAPGMSVSRRATNDCAGCVVGRLFDGANPRPLNSSSTFKRDCSNGDTHQNRHASQRGAQPVAMSCQAHGFPRWKCGVRGRCQRGPLLLDPWPLPLPPKGRSRGQIRFRAPSSPRLKVGPLAPARRTLSAPQPQSPQSASGVVQ
jgi:hypothetical protein